MTPEQRDVHGEHEDERNRDKREKRIKTAADDLAKARAHVCLSASEELRDPGEDGCYW